MTKVLDLDAFIQQSIKQQAEIKAKKKSGKKLKASTQEVLDKARERLDAINKAHLDLGWKDHAVILMMIRNTCACCGSVYTTPNTHIFVKRENKALGIHYKEIDFQCDRGEYARLPHIIEYEEISSTHCPECFEFSFVQQNPLQLELAL